MYLAKLAHLMFDGFDCEGSELALFLQNHSLLIELTLENVKVTGGVTYAEVLRSVAVANLRFRASRSWQTSEGGLRTRFRSPGDV